MTTTSATGGNDRRSRRARSFGDDPGGYDGARPSYPDALIDDLLRPDPASEPAGPDLQVLDVGCGTGKAARLLAARGAHVLGVEADERMAAVARRHGLTVEVAPFEAWDPQDRRFDLLTAAQAWHWVDPVGGPAAAARVLRPGGRLALFWNLRRRPSPEVAAVFEALYARHAPELSAEALTLGGRSEADGLEAHLDDATGSGHFVDGEVRRYTWHTSYDPAAWRALLATQSDHRLLAPDRRQALLDAAAAAIDQLGGTLSVEYVTLLLLARRR